MDETRRSFLRMVSHELRTPLNSVIGFSEIISRELYGPIGDPRYRDHAELVNQSGLRLLKLVNDVIDIARLEAGAMDLVIRPEPCGVAIEEALRSLRPEATAKDVTIVYTACESDPLILVDQRGFERVIGNLVQNAIANSPVGGVVNVRCRVQGRRAAFEVADDGWEVSPEDLERILKPFEQVESALIRRTEGGGLGLAIVSLLTRSMNGRFTVASVPGAGMTAVVAFRIATQPVEEPVATPQ
jgi:signal transduction histidine kinase